MEAHNNNLSFFLLSKQSIWNINSGKYDRLDIIIVSDAWADFFVRRMMINMACYCYQAPPAAATSFCSTIYLYNDDKKDLLL